jgi:hypothetical protein
MLLEINASESALPKLLLKMVEVTLYQKQRRSFFMVQSIPSVTSSNPQFAFSIIAFVSIGVWIMKT